MPHVDAGLYRLIPEELLASVPLSLPRTLGAVETQEKAPSVGHVRPASQEPPGLIDRQV